MAVKRVNADLEVAGEVIAAGENLSRKIEYLEHLVPEAPLPLAGLEFENVAGGVRSGGLADDGVVDHYAYGLSPGDVGVGKPNPRIYEIMLSRLKATLHQTVMIGNSLTSDVAGPQGLGMKAVWLNRAGDARRDDVVPDLEVSNLHEFRRAFGEDAVFT